ncbi:MAG: 50S ribosomal protein L25 [Thermodesulfobacteriota bacterium]
MMELKELEVFIRGEKGKGAAHRLRREGKVPGILYGPGIENSYLSFRAPDLKKILTTGARENTLIELKIRHPQSDKVEKKVAMLKEVQLHPVQRTYLHADFYAVAMDRKIEVEVPIRLVGKAEGTKAGGILEQPRREVRIRCLPLEIPDYIEVDISNLKIGDSLHVLDIPPSPKYEIVAETNFTVASVVPPISEAKYEEIVSAEAAKEVVQPERIGEKKEEPEQEKE